MRISRSEEDDMVIARRAFVSRLAAIAGVLAASPVAVASADDCGESMSAYSPARQNIVETAVQAGTFNTLVTAVKEAGLVDALSGDGPLTVFAPTDEAFAKLGEDTIKAVLADKELLTKILTYHVVSGRVTSGDVVKLQTAPTLQGQDVRISTMGGVRINDSMVVTADIETTNGIIHVIDAVLLPA
jgi:uncharacterized surface protein with fasciclin (FAS1) repeats